MVMGLVVYWVSIAVRVLVVVRILFRVWVMAGGWAWVRVVAMV